MEREGENSIDSVSSFEGSIAICVLLPDSSHPSVSLPFTFASSKYGIPLPYDSMSPALPVIVDDHSLYTTCSLINGRAYLHSGMVSIIFFLTKYCCSSIPEVPSIVTNPSDWAIESYCSIILLWNIL